MNAICHKARKKLREEKFCIIKSVFEESEINEYKSLINSQKANFPIIQDTRKYDQLFIKSLKRIVGGSIYSGKPVTRAMEIIYLPIEGQNIVDKISSKLIKFRNLFLGLDINFANSSKGDYFTIPKLHRYPKGGGFLSGHEDNFADDFNLGLQEKA